MENHHADSSVEQRLPRVTDGRALQVIVRRIVIINGGHAWPTAEDERRWNLLRSCCYQRRDAGRRRLPQPLVGPQRFFLARSLTRGALTYLVPAVARGRSPRATLAPRAGAARGDRDREVVPASLAARARLLSRDHQMDIRAPELARERPPLRLGPAPEHGVRPGSLRSTVAPTPRPSVDSRRQARAQRLRALRIAVRATSRLCSI